MGLAFFWNIWALVQFHTVPHITHPNCSRILANILQCKQQLHRYSQLPICQVIIRFVHFSLAGIVEITHILGYHAFYIYNNYHFSQMEGKLFDYNCLHTCMTIRITYKTLPIKSNEKTSDSCDNLEFSLENISWGYGSKVAFLEFHINCHEQYESTYLCRRAAASWFVQNFGIMRG
jgi:hypothetical protein